jgi:3-hydroxybutyrate dehydrogenase
MQAQAKALSQHGAEVLTSTANLLEPAEIRALVRDVHARFGRIDVLVNNAGLQHVAPVHTFPEDRWDAILGVVLSAPFHATKAVLPHMLDAGRGGRIVNTCSFHGLVASPFKAPYVAAKHGVAGFTKSVALEVAKAGITVNAVCPGYVLTELVERQLNDTARARGITVEEVMSDVLLRPQPIGRFVRVEEVADFVHYLCGDAAAAITGAVLPIDGGWTAQ